jgi:hypothetical protein
VTAKVPPTTTFPEKFPVPVTCSVEVGFGVLMPTSPSVVNAHPFHWERKAITCRCGAEKQVGAVVVVEGLDGSGGHGAESVVYPGGDIETDHVVGAPAAVNHGIFAHLERRDGRLDVLVTPHPDLSGEVGRDERSLQRQWQ